LRSCLPVTRGQNILSYITYDVKWLYAADTAVAASAATQRPHVLPARYAITLLSFNRHIEIALCQHFLAKKQNLLI
jgi:hypothetical protein